MPIRGYRFGVDKEPAPNVVMRGGTLDAQQLHLGRGKEPATYRSPSGERYEATNTWEHTLRVYRLAPLAEIRHQR